MLLSDYQQVLQWGGMSELLLSLSRHARRLTRTRPLPFNRRARFARASDIRGRTPIGRVMNTKILGLFRVPSRLPSPCSHIFQGT